MDYQFRPLGKLCAATGKPLTPGGWCHSVIVDKDGSLQRLDFSEEGWTEQPPHTIAHWRVKAPEGPAVEQIRLDPDALMRYFVQLSEEASVGTEPTRYVLALYLLKTQRLELIDAQADEEGDLLELAGVHGEGLFAVRDLKLDDATVRTLQTGLRQQLAADWS